MYPVLNLIVHEPWLRQGVWGNGWCCFCIFRTTEHRKCCCRRSVLYIFFLAVSRVCVLDCGTSVHPFILLRIEHWNTRQYGSSVSGATPHISQSSLDLCIWYLNSAEAGCRTSFASIATPLLDGEQRTCPTAQWLPPHGRPSFQAPFALWWFLGWS